jgi:hypothetical protein
VKNEVAKFMLKEIDEKIAKRRKSLAFSSSILLVRVRSRIEAGGDLGANDAECFQQLWQRMTDPARLKWGNFVRPL